MGVAGGQAAGNELRTEEGKEVRPSEWTWVWIWRTRTRTPPEENWRLIFREKPNDPAAPYAGCGLRAAGCGLRAAATQYQVSSGIPTPSFLTLIPVTSRRRGKTRLLWDPYLVSIVANPRDGSDSFEL